jgi:hypothetical protein
MSNAEFFFIFVELLSRLLRVIPAQRRSALEKFFVNGSSKGPEAVHQMM